MLNVVHHVECGEIVLLKVTCFCFIYIIQWTCTCGIIEQISCAIFVPHWTAALVVFPMMFIHYIDVFGVLQIAGITIAF